MAMTTAPTKSPVIPARIKPPIAPIGMTGIGMSIPRPRNIGSRNESLTINHQIVKRTWVTAGEGGAGQGETNGGQDRLHDGQSEHARGQLRIAWVARSTAASPCLPPIRAPMACAALPPPVALISIKPAGFRRPPSPVSAGCNLGLSILSRASTAWRPGTSSEKGRP
jgi:hypothetical protein